MNTELNDDEQKIHEGITKVLKLLNGIRTHTVLDILTFSLAMVAAEAAKEDLRAEALNTLKKNIDHAFYHFIN